MGYDKFHNKSGLARSRGSIASGVIAKDGFSLDGPPTRPYSAIRADKAEATAEVSDDAGELPDDDVEDSLPDAPA